MIISNISNKREFEGLSIDELVKRGLNVDNHYFELMQDFEKIFEDVEFLDWDELDDEIATENFSGKYFVPVQNAFYLLRFSKNAACFPSVFGAIWYTEKNLFIDLEEKIQRVSDLLASDKVTFYKKVLLRGVRTSLRELRKIFKRHYVRALEDLNRDIKKDL